MRIVAFLIILMTIFGLVGWALVLRSRVVAKGYEVQATRERLYDVRNENDMLRVVVSEGLRVSALAAAAMRFELELGTAGVVPAPAKDRRHVNASLIR